jgi:hypothetical protein
MFTAAEAMVVGPVPGLASVTLSVGGDDLEPPFGRGQGASPLINGAAQTGQSEPARSWRGRQATAIARAQAASAPAAQGLGFWMPGRLRKDSG